MAIDLHDLETRRHVVAANIRARMGWLDMSRPELADKTGISQRTLFDRLEGVRPFKDDQLWKIAAALGLETPGPLYEIPAGFPALTSRSSSACSRTLSVATRHLRVAA